MKKIFWVFLSVSLAANVWLLSRPKSPTAADRITPGTLASNGGAKSSAVPLVLQSPNGKSTTADAARIATVIKGLVEMDETDLPGARDRLRALGADEKTVFAAVDGVIVLDYIRLQLGMETENIRNGWWRGNAATLNKPEWGKLAEGRLFSVMGYDPHDIADYRSRFDFVPPEKAEALAKIAQDYWSMHLRAVEDPSSPRGASELMMAARRADVVKMLTPEELAEYDFRFSDAAAQNSKRFAKMQVTEQEFRTLMPLIERVQQENAALPRDQTFGPASQALEQRVFDDLVSAVGYDRAADYVWSGTNVIVRDPNNPNATVLSAVSSPPRLMQLASETGAAAAAIHYDTRRSAEEKRAALLALQAATQPKLDKLMSPDARADLDPRALTWFNVLAKGEYVLLTPRATGVGTTVVQPISVIAPVRGDLPSAPRLRPSK